MMKLKSSKLSKRATRSKSRVFNLTTSKCIKKRKIWRTRFSINERRNAKLRYLNFDWYFFWITWVMRLEMFFFSTTKATSFKRKLNKLFWTTELKNAKFFEITKLKNIIDFFWINKMLKCFFWTIEQEMLKCFFRTIERKMLKCFFRTIEREMLKCFFWTIERNVFS